MYTCQCIYITCRRSWTCRHACMSSSTCTCAMLRTSMCSCTQHTCTCVCTCIACVHMAVHMVMHMHLYVWMPVHIRSRVSILVHACTYTCNTHGHILFTPICSVLKAAPSFSELHAEWKQSMLPGPTTIVYLVSLCLREFIASARFG